MCTANPCVHFFLVRPMAHECGWFAILVEDVRIMIRAWVYDSGRDLPSAHALNWTCCTEQSASPMTTDDLDRHDIGCGLVRDAICLNYTGLVVHFYWPMIRSVAMREQVIGLCLEYERLDMLGMLMQNSPLIRLLLAGTLNPIYNSWREYYIDACRSSSTRVLDWLHNVIKRPLQRTRGSSGIHLRDGGGLMQHFSELFCAVVDNRDPKDDTEAFEWLKAKNTYEKSTNFLFYDLAGSAFCKGRIAQTRWLLTESNLDIDAVCNKGNILSAIGGGHASAVRWLAEQISATFHDRITTHENVGDCRGGVLCDINEPCFISACINHDAIPLLVFLEKTCGLTLEGHMGKELMKMALVSREAMQFMRDRGHPWCTDAMIHVITKTGHDVPVLRWMISVGCPCTFAVAEWSAIIQS